MVELVGWVTMVLIGWALLTGDVNIEIDDNVVAVVLTYDPEHNYEVREVVDTVGETVDQITIIND